MAVIRTYGLLFSNDRFGFILPPLFLAVIAEASRSMRYGTGSIAETAIRDLILITAHFCPAQFNDLRARGKQHCGNFLTTDPSHVVIAEARAHTRYGTGSVVMFDCAESPTKRRFRTDRLTSIVPYAVRFVLRNDEERVKK